MQRSHLLRWLALAVGLLGTQCLDSISDDCSKTLTCPGQPQPVLKVETCTWEYSDGRPWPDGPRYDRATNLWRWPDGKPTDTQDFVCDLNLADAGVDAGPAGPDCRVNVTCDTGQVCDESSGSCVECVDDSQCAGNMAMGDAGAATVCDRLSHRCVECVDSGSCSGDTRVCKVDEANSRRNACVECLVGTDCGAPTPICDDRTNDCTATCQSPADCAAGDKKACNTALQLCVECTGNENCSTTPGKPLCDTDDNRCVECLDDGQCAATGRVCDLESHACVECREDAQCQVSADAALRPVCDADANVCVGCVNDLQCTSSTASRCNRVARECTGCTNSSQCEGNAQCNTMTGRCVECVTNQDCAGVPGRPECEGVSGRCVECLLTSQCLSEELAHCETLAPEGDPARYTCVGCVNEADCAGKNLPGLCDVGRNGICVNCVGTGASADCVDQGTSLSRCQSGNCVVCVENADCELFGDAPDNAPVCKEDAGCVQCVQNADCAARMGTPICKTAPGTNPDEGSGPAAINTCVECTSDEQCQLNPGASRCFNNACVPCASNQDCSLVDSNGTAVGGIDLAVCDSGTCVQCTGPQNGECAGGANVCNSLTKQCTMTAVRSADPCGTCVSDLQCQTTARCAGQTIGGAVQYFCYPLQSGGVCATNGFANLASVATIDSPSAALCLQRETNCPAFLDYVSGQACDDADDDGACGDGEGTCAFGPQGFRCTISCISAADCSGGSCLSGLCQL